MSEEYDATPLTVAGLRAILADLPDDMPVWGTYDVAPTAPDVVMPVYQMKTDRPVLRIDS